MTRKKQHGPTKITIMVETVPLEMPMEIVKDMVVTKLKGMAIKMPRVVPKTMAMATATAMVEALVMEAMAVEVDTPIEAIWSQQRMVGEMVGETLGFNPKTSAVTPK